MRVATDAQEGLYSLYFHSCPNYGKERVKMNMVVSIAWSFSCLVHHWFSDWNWRKQFRKFFIGGGNALACALFHDGSFIFPLWLFLGIYFTKQPPPRVQNSLLDGIACVFEIAIAPVSRNQLSFHRNQRRTYRNLGYTLLHHSFVIISNVLFQFLCEFWFQA